MRIKVISLIIAIIYITIILSLGFGVKDDYFLWAFPSWPIFIGCFENCGETRMIIATILNGALVGLICNILLTEISRKRKSN